MELIKIYYTHILQSNNGEWADLHFMWYEKWVDHVKFNAKSRDGFDIIRCFVFAAGNGVGVNVKDS